MPNYSNTELADVVICYVEAGQNAYQGRLLYQERFPDRRLPSRHTFLSAMQHLREHGSFHRTSMDRGRSRSQRTLNAEPLILEAVEENPGVSIRRLSRQIGVSGYVVWRTLNEQGLHPYHVQKVQALKPGDGPRRRRYCAWLLEKCQEQPTFLKYVLFSDEAVFAQDGISNLHNTHIWCDENPHATLERRHHHPFSLNVWAGILGDHLIGPFILPNRLTGGEYLQFLTDNLPDLLDDVPLATLQRMWYLHDGAPQHYSRNVVNYLNDNYPNRWIGRNGPVVWPPRSPDLNPCDYFLWGFMRQTIYGQPVNTLQQLRERIEVAAQQVRDLPNIFENVRASLLRRAQACTNNNGMHFQHLL